MTGFDEKVCLMMQQEAEAMAGKIVGMKEIIEKMVDTEEKTSNVAAMYVALDRINETIDTARKELNKFNQFLSYTKLPEMLDHDGAKSVNTVFGFRVTVATRTSVTMVDPDKGKQWLRDNGYSDIIKETVNSATLGSLVKNMIETLNKEPPSDVFEVKAAPYVSVTKTR